ncbi:MAG: carbohydrate ABC transporter permease [Bacillota bacterium]
MAKSARGVWERAIPYLLIAPSLVVFLTFFIYPILYSIYLSFMKWNLISPTKTFIGLDNYRELFLSEEFHMALKNTLVYTVGVVSVSLTIALLLALLLNTEKKWAAWVQAAMFSPHIISLVSVSILWLWLMDPDFGLLNWFLGLFGVPPLKWIASDKTALFSLIIVAIWKVVGYDMVVFLAGLQSIPPEMYEAAKIDGAGAVRRLRHVTLPLLSPTIFFLTVTSVISSFQVFDIVKIMTGGGPADSTNVMVFYVYEYGFRFFKIGHASAASVVLFLMVLGMTILQFRWVERKVHYS